MWLKCDDGLAEHPKFFAASLHLTAAPPSTPLGRVLAVWLESALFSARNLSDGFIPHRVVETLRVDQNPLEVFNVFAREDVQLCHLVEGGFQLHDWSDYQPNSRKVKEKRRKDLARKRRTATAATTAAQTGAQDSARNPRGIHRESLRILQVPSPTPLDQDQDPRSAALSIADVRKPLKALLHARLDQAPVEDLGELLEIAKRGAVQLGATWRHARELAPIVDEVQATRARRGA